MIEVNTNHAQLTIGLVGPCGSGKSTLAQAFANIPNVNVILESPPQCIEADLPYRDLDIPGIQREFLEARLERAKGTWANLTVFDRTFQEDRNVFLRLHYELGGLTSTELDQLDKLGERAEALVGSLHANVCLFAAPGTLRHRIGNRARPSWLVDSLDRQLELYASLLANIRGVVLEVDTTTYSAKALKEIAPWIAKTAPSAIASAQSSEETTAGLRWIVR
jgi:deoxyadenosine/deoxycytidine kinase